MSNERIDTLLVTVPDATSTLHCAGLSDSPAGSEALYETEIGAIFSDVLGVSQVASDDNFYALGGHSLLVVKLVRRIRRKLNIDLDTAEIFDEPTPAAIARLLTERATGRRDLDIGVRPPVIPLSPGQKRLWYLNRLDSAKRAYNIPIVLLLAGDLDIAALRAAVRDIVDRHEVLRTVISERDGEPRQQVLAAGGLEIGVEEVETEPSEVATALAADAAYEFDLSSETPFRTRLHTCGVGEYALSLVVHHIAADGASIDLLCHDLAEAYTARCAGRSPSWRPLVLQYADYTLWHLRALGDEGDPDSVVSKQLDYWRMALAGLPEEIALPVDRPRLPSGPGAEGFATATVHAPVYRRVADLARAEGLTMFMIAQAAVAVVLYLNGAGADIPLGSPVEGRVEDELEPLIGFFINTLVLRTVLSGDPSMAAVLRRVRATALAAYAHQDLPFDRLVEEINPTRVPGRLPLYQTSVSWTAAEKELPSLPGVRVTRGTSSPALAAKFPLAFEFAEQRSADPEGPDLSVEVVYDSALFDKSTASQLANSAAALLSVFVDHPSMKCSALRSLDQFAQLSGDGANSPGTVARTEDPSRGTSLSAQGSTEVPAQAPRSDSHAALEQVIAGVWRDVLRLDHVDAHDNFFAIGGDSIESMRIVHRLSKLGIAVTPEDLLANQTVAKLAAVVPRSTPTAKGVHQSASSSGSTAALTTADAATIAERFG